MPSALPSPLPSSMPSTLPPSAFPSPAPTKTFEPSAAPSPAPSESPEPSEEPTDSEEPSEQPTTTDEPSDQPTETAEPSEVPTIFNTERIESSAFTLRYVLRAGTPPVLGVNLPGLLRVTDDYLLDILRVAFVGTVRSVQTLFVDGLDLPNDDLVFITFRTEIFGDFTRGQASRARLDEVIARAFSGLSADVYVGRLQNVLPAGNRFSRTIEVDDVNGIPDLGAVEGTAEGAVEGAESVGIPLELP